MKARITKIISMAMIILFCSTSSLSISADDSKGENSESLGALALVFHQHLPKLESLQKRYFNAKKAKDDDEKGKLKMERNAVTESLIHDIDQFNKTTPLEGKELPFAVVSENLPFNVLSIKIDEVTYKAIKFIVQVKINQDIKNTDGEFSERISIHFVAVDSEDNIIPKTWNWATNHDWVKLEKDTIYDAKGHWNAKRVQNMHDFSTINIMSKVDYKKMKESQ